MLRHNNFVFYIFVFCLSNLSIFSVHAMEKRNLESYHSRSVPALAVNDHRKKKLIAVLNRARTPQTNTWVQWKEGLEADEDRFEWNELLFLATGIIRNPQTKGEYKKRMKRYKEKLCHLLAKNFTKELRKFKKTVIHPLMEERKQLRQNRKESDAPLPLIIPMLRFNRNLLLHQWFNSSDYIEDSNAVEEYWDLHAKIIELYNDNDEIAALALYQKCQILLGEAYEKDKDVYVFYKSLQTHDRFNNDRWSAYKAMVDLQNRIALVQAQMKTTPDNEELKTLFDDLDYELSMERCRFRQCYPNKIKNGLKVVRDARTNMKRFVAILRQDHPKFRQRMIKGHAFNRAKQKLEEDLHCGVGGERCDGYKEEYAAYKFRKYFWNHLFTKEFFKRTLKKNWRSERQTHLQNFLVKKFEPRVEKLLENLLSVE